MSKPSFLFLMLSISMVVCRGQGHDMEGGGHSETTVMPDCLEDGKTYMGNNIVKGEDNVQDTMHDCQQSCAKHPKCEQWTWGKLSYMGLPGRFAGWCCLKSSKSGDIGNPPHVVTGTKNCPTDSYIDGNSEPLPTVVKPDCLEDGKNYMGNNIVEGKDNLQDAMHDCQQSCAKHPKCEQWTWGKLSLPGRFAGWCYLKSSKSGDIENIPDVVTGTKNCPTDSYIDGNSESLPTVGCLVNGSLIKEGDVYEEDPCTTCTCTKLSSQQYEPICVAIDCLPHQPGFCIKEGDCCESPCHDMEGGGHSETTVMPDCLEDGISYKGNNIVDGEDNVQDTIHDCQQSCAKHPKCVQWSWGKLEGRFAGWCYLKSSKTGKILKLPDVVTGTKDCPTDSYIDENSEPLPTVVMPDCLEDGKNYIGNNIVEGEDNLQDTMHDCQQSCAKHPKCEQWTWGKLEGRFAGWCYHKSSKAGDIETLPDVVTGTKNCPTDSYIDGNSEPLPRVVMADCLEDGISYQGNNIVEGEDNVQDTMHDCQQSCAKHPKCEQWTWGKLSYMSLPGRFPGWCYLKSSKTGEIFKIPDVVTGTKDCPTDSYIDSNREPSPKVGKAC